MTTENHTVTLPIADYNELLKGQELLGLMEVEVTSKMHKDICFLIHKDHLAKCIKIEYNQEELLEKLRIYIKFLR